MLRLHSLVVVIVVVAVAELVTYHVIAAATICVG